LITTDDFVRDFAQRAAQIAGVEAVTLGGSRAQGTHGPESDYDFAIYYRGRLDPDDVRNVGWSGRVFAPGEWGGGVMNGGAFLVVEGRKVDLHYRDLDEVLHWCDEAREGRFEVQRLPLYLAGIPTYVVVGELAIAQVLVGTLPRPGFPPALRATAPPFWRGSAQLNVSAARGYAARGVAPECVGSLARALLEEAHARAAERGIWVLNEKRLLDAVDLGGVRKHFEAGWASVAALSSLSDAVASVIAI
jgi:predicted nucleotidyltransferase